MLAKAPGEPALIWGESVLKAESCNCESTGKRDVANVAKVKTQARKRY